MPIPRSFWRCPRAIRGPVGLSAADVSRSATLHIFKIFQRFLEHSAQGVSVCKSWFFRLGGTAERMRRLPMQSFISFLGSSGDRNRPAIGHLEVWTALTR